MCGAAGKKGVNVPLLFRHRQMKVKHVSFERVGRQNICTSFRMHLRSLFHSYRQHLEEFSDTQKRGWSEEDIDTLFLDKDDTDLGVSSTGIVDERLKVGGKTL